MKTLGRRTVSSAIDVAGARSIAASLMGRGDELAISPEHNMLPHAATRRRPGQQRGRRHDAGRMGATIFMGR